MKRWVSVFALWTRRWLWKELALLGLMLAAELALYLPNLYRNDGGGLEMALSVSHPEIAVAAGFLLLSAWHYVCASDFGGRQSYTLSRLSVPSFGGYLCHALSVAASYVLFWAAQTGIALLLCALWKRQFAGTELWGVQTTLLAFYRNSFFHALLPMAERIVYVRNCFLCLALGAAFARVPLQKNSRVGLICALLVPAWFRHDMGDFVNDLLMIFLSVGVIGLCVFFSPYREEVTPDETETV